MKKLARLMEPGKIGNMELRNRLVKAPTDCDLADEDGHVTPELIDFYVARARGGTGLVVVEATSISTDTPGVSERWLNTNDDTCIPGLKDLTKAVQSHGAKIALELWHGGPALASFGHPELVIGASAVPLHSYGKTGPVPKVASREDIKKLISDFSEAAVRAKKAGFDAVMLHGAQYYILSSFQSPYTNKRTDEYGGSPEKRARFGSEVIAGIREKVGPDFPIIMRMNGHDFNMEGGLTIEEAAIQAPLFVEAGADAIDVTYGIGQPPTSTPGSNIKAAAAVKKAVNVPVIVAGKIDVYLGEKTLEEGTADFIAMGRGLLVDPELPNKVAEGRLDDITPCSCCFNCNDWIYAEIAEPIHCRMNAALGREREFEIKPAEKKKKVMIAGAGPAGLEAARVAAIRGHEVLLYDKQHKLGGLIPLASIIKGVRNVKKDPGQLIENLGGVLRYFKHQTAKLGVKIRLGKEVTPALVGEVKPDVLIIASGGIITIPEIPGIDRRNVVNAVDLHRMLKRLIRFFGPGVLKWLTGLWMPMGKRVVIIGGSMHGIELAEFLIRRGRKVTMVEESDEMGYQMQMDDKFQTLAWLADKCTMITGVKYEEITDKGLVITTREGEKQLIEVDTVVPATLLRPDTELLEALEGTAPEVYVIGDSREPHLIRTAIADGSRIARLI